MNKALIIVDFQNDFLPLGALGVPDGHRAYPLLERLMRDVDVIVFTRDWHPENHCSFVEPGLNPEYRDGSWPKHCVQNTEGADIDDDLWDAAIETGKRVIVVSKGTDPNVEAYSGFAGTVTRVYNDSDLHTLEDASLAQALVSLSVRELKIGGLALDYCVKATCSDASKLNYRATLYLNATRPVAYLSGVQAVADLAYRTNVILDAREF